MNLLHFIMLRRILLMLKTRSFQITILLIAEIIIINNVILSPQIILHIFIKKQKCKTMCTIVKITRLTAQIAKLNSYS